MDYQELAETIAEKLTSDQQEAILNPKERQFPLVKNYGCIIVVNGEAQWNPEAF